MPSILTLISDSRELISDVKMCSEVVVYAVFFCFSTFLFDITLTILSYFETVMFDVLLMLLDTGPSRLSLSYDGFSDEELFALPLVREDEGIDRCITKRANDGRESVARKISSCFISI